MSLRHICFPLVLVAGAAASLGIVHRPGRVLPSPGAARQVRPAPAAAPVRPEHKPALAGRVHGPRELVFLRTGWLCTMPIARSGRPAGAVRRIRRLQTAPVVSLVVSPDGRWAAVDEWQQGRDNRSMVLLVEVRSGGAALHLAGGSEPSFSPDGRTLAFTSEADSFGSNVCLRDLLSGQERVLRSGARGPCWLADGRQVAVDDEDAAGQGGPSYMVLEAQSGHIVDRFSRGISPLTAIVSPDGRYVGVCHKISRPQVGSSIFDRQSRRELDVGWSIKGYNPALLTSWSRDGQGLLWDLTVSDPENDGSNGGDTVAYSSFDGSTRRLFGRGVEGHFAPDSRHVLWIDSWRHGEQGAYRLLWCSLDGKPRVLLNDVDAFDIVM